MAAPPAVALGEADAVIGEVVLHAGNQLVGVYRRRVSPQPVHRHPEGLLHLGGAGPQLFHPLRRQDAQHRVHGKAPLVGEEVQLCHHLHRRLWDGQLLPGLPQGAGRRILPRLHPPAGEAHLPGLAAQRIRPHLVQQTQALRPLGQGHQHRVLPVYILQFGGVARPAGPEIVQCHSCFIHSFRAS